MASLKERMQAYKSAGDDTDFKERSGNKETPQTVGKLTHAYLEKDAKSTPTKRNFKIGKRASADDTNKPEKLNLGKRPSADDVNKPGKLNSPFLSKDKGDETEETPTKPPKRKSFGIFSGVSKNKRESGASVSSSASSKSRGFKSNPMSYLKSKARGSGSGAGIRLNEGGSAPPPPKRLSILTRRGPKKQSSATQAFALVKNKSRADEVEQLLNQINAFQGFTLMKRLSIRDNDLVQGMQKVIGNESKQTSIKIDSDVRFSHLKASLVQDFGDSIRQNLYLKTLTIRGVELGNTFLEALSSAIMENVTLEEIDLSRNHLTHDAMVEFCQALEFNHTIKTVYLQTQLSPLYEKGTEKVLAALEKNHSVRKMKIDFQDPAAGTRLKAILQRNYWNKNGYEKPDPDDMLINFLKEEVIRAEEQFELKEQEKELEEVRSGDWDYLYELAVLFDTFKIQKDIDDDTGVGGFASPMHEARSSGVGGFGAGKNPLTGAQGFPSDGSFLHEEFISGYLREDIGNGELVFDFSNQFRLFKQFPATSPDRETIVNCFVYELLHHPRQHEFTGINMANTGCGNDFWVKISEQVCEDPSLLPNVHLINSETNFVTENGIVAIANMIKSEKSMRYIQSVKLENQKALLSSKAERALARSICVNLSVVRFSLRVRNLLERDQINKYVCRNIDFLRQARQHHKKKSGITTERKRNKMEQLFDKIAANDATITKVDIAADNIFKGLSDKEKVKCGEAFSTNTYVTSITLNALGLGDDFASALGESLTVNDSIEKICIEGNSIGGPGFKGLFKGLGRNDSVLELRAKHQTKSMASPDEQELPGLVETNKTITKFSMDLRNSAITMKLDQIGSRNREARRKMNKKTSLVSDEDAVDAAKALVKEEPEAATEASRAFEQEPEEEDDFAIAEETDDDLAEEEDDNVIAKEPDEDLGEDEDENVIAEEIEEDVAEEEGDATAEETEEVAEEKAKEPAIEAEPTAEEAVPVPEPVETEKEVEPETEPELKPEPEPEPSQEEKPPVEETDPTPEPEEKAEAEKKPETEINPEPENEEEATAENSEDEAPVENEKEKKMKAFLAKMKKRDSSK